jgi:hypothetical protein
MRFLIVLIFALCAAGRAEAYNSTTQYLYEMCKNESTIGVCAGYVAAVGEFTETMGIYKKQGHPDVAQFSICMPEPAPSHAEMTQVFVNWAQAHPEASSQLQVVQCDNCTARKMALSMTPLAR